MIKLFQIEYYKLKHNRVYWILLVLYLAVIAIAFISLKLFFNWLTTKGADFEGLSPNIIPIYDFPDIWQNVTWGARFFRTILAFIVIISMASEFGYKTVRQNIIDGFSRTDFLVSKLSLSAVLALISTLWVGLIVLLLGAIYSTSGEPIFQGSQFLLSYFIETFGLLVFAQLFTLLLRHTGFAIALVTLYVNIIEPLVGLIFRVRDNPIWNYFPVEATRSLIYRPIDRYWLSEIQDYTSWHELAILLAYIALFIYLMHLLLTRRNL